jgi:flavodoxin
MKAIVVFESHWGNTAAIAGAIAAGHRGGGAGAVDGGSHWFEVVAGADLIVAGSPLARLCVAHGGDAQGHGRRRRQ